MKRSIEKYLLHWKNQKEHLPLLVRGARQVGKTFVVESFGKQHFEHIVTINFELHVEMKKCFDSLDPKDIINNIFLMTGQKIVAQKTLLFLDEIQDCPNAIRSLRYFKEKLPKQHVIGAGSLLEFVLNDTDFRMPVGRVQSIYLKPMSFKEFLRGSGNQQLCDLIETVNLDSTIATNVHDKLLKLLYQYMVLGGMPAVLKTYFQTEDLSECQQIQTMLLYAYRQDFGKYAKQTDHCYLQRLYDKIPGLIGANFKYSKVDPDMRSRDLKEALYLLQQAGLVYPIYCSSASGVPLETFIREKIFKILFLDIGLVMRAGRLDAEVLIEQDIMFANRGMLAEQFVGQELIAEASPFEDASLFFWTREQKSSTAEVDFVTTVNTNIIPIEVKSGKTGRLKSLQIFMAEKQSPWGIKLSQESMHKDQKIISLPLYLTSEIHRIVNLNIGSDTFGNKK